MKKIILFLTIALVLFSKEIIYDSEAIDQLIFDGKNKEIIKLIETKYSIDTQDSLGYSFLMKAVLNLNFDLVNYLIDKGANLNIKNVKGISALAIAIQIGDVDLVDMLLKKGAIPENNSDLLIWAIGNDYHAYNMVKFLLDRGVDVNSIESFPIKPLIHSITAQKTDITELLMEKGANIDGLSITGKDALMLLIQSNDTDLAKKIIAKGIDTSIRDFDGNNYLHYAVKFENIELIELLCQLGVNPHAKNIDRESPRDLADGELNILKLLINNKSTQAEILFHALETFNDKLALETCQKMKNINIFNDKGETPLVFAIKNSSFDVIKALIDRGCDINQYSGSRYRTPLIEAIVNRRTDIALYLIKMGAKITIDDGYGKSARDYLIEKSDLELIKYFLKENKNINKTDSEGKTLLMKACESDKEELIELLIKEGANINQKDFDGFSALTYAVRSNNYKVFQNFLDKGADINVIDEEGNNLLFHSLKNDFSIITDILIENLPLNHKNISGHNNFYNAMDNENIPSAIELVGKGIEIQIDDYSQTIFDYIMRENNLTFLKLLVDNGLDVDLINIRNNLLRMAISYESFDIFKYLLTLKNSSLKRSDLQISALNEALEEGKIVYFEYLLNNTSLSSKQLVLYFKENTEKIIANTGDMGKKIIEIFTKKGMKLDTKYLYYAVNSNNIELVNHLIKNGVPLTYIDEDGNNLLFSALARGNYEVADNLISKGLSINTLNKKKVYLIYNSLGANPEFETLNYLIRKGIKLENELVKEYAYPLFCLNANDPVKFKYYFDFMKLNESIWNDDGFDYFIKNKYFDAMKFLYENRDKVNFDNPFTSGNTLELLIKSDNLEMLDFIYNIDKEEVDSLMNFSQNTFMFDIMTEIHSLDMINWLKNKGGDLTYIDQESKETLLHKAVLSKNLFLTNYCLENKFDINLKNIDGKNPLELANSDDNIDIFKILFKITNSKDFQKLVYDAASGGNILILEYLISNGVKLEDYDSEGSLLLQAIEGNRDEMSKYLISKGYKVRGKDLKGMRIDDDIEVLLQRTKAYY